MYAPTEHVGAVHLELGTFTTFPDERVSELVAGDGLSEFIRLDFDRHYGPDVVADVTQLPFAQRDASTASPPTRSSSTSAARTRSSRRPSASCARAA